MKQFLIVTALILLSLLSFAQSPESPLPYFTYGKGLGITSPDSLFMLNIRFRMQNRLAFTTESADNLNLDKVEARVRRLRLRFDGFIYSRKLTYVIQLAFSRGDLDFDDTGFPNIIRDAMVLYRVNEHLTVGAGQTKLPGNRQRINSSGDLQFADRSIVNSAFNIDRDFGVQVYYQNNISKVTYGLRGAISSGEGRNFNSSDRGLAYTGRVELLPLGPFTNGGDYFEGDLEREPTPKLSLGASYSNNQNAIRTGGQLGTFLYDSRDITTEMVDFLFKYNGWAFAAEYLRRMADDPITTNLEGDQRYVYTGHGQNYQGSYLFRKNLELAARYSEVRPNLAIQTLTPRVRQYTMGVTRYIKGHRVKLQTDLTYEIRHWLKSGASDMDNWQLRFQIEIGI